MSQNNSQSQRFCLRWNNHQSNLLAVFDQLLTSEAFVDVTLAVEGQMLRAHKMVLSACSPYFQTLFVGHPDRHPIVILKDVPLVDMRSLLDFMYRGEVSVDQDRLAAFLKVAESLRIKGLTEVNEDRGDLPSLASSLLQSHSSSPSSSPVHNNQMVHVPQLQRIHNHSPMSLKRPLPSHPLHDQQRQQLSYPMNPLLGSALTAPKRKRGRPRKLSTGSNSPSRPSDNNNDDSRASTPIGTSAGSGRDPPDLLELNMSEESESAAAAPKYYDSPKDENTIEDEEMEEEFVETENGIVIKQEPSDPIPGTSQDLSTLKKDHDSQSSLQLDQSVCESEQICRLSLESNGKNDSDNMANITGRPIMDKYSVRQFCTQESTNLFRCKLCRKTYTHISNFCRHFLSSHHGVRQEIPCPVCFRMFTRRDNMLTHMKQVHRLSAPKVYSTNNNVGPRFKFNNL
ncbi:protein tramtrack, beta isoform-like isoform X2 [Daktulosphaira vitifoliae]|uniref:protein tramtrack, beta isoform-like isoform X2 n=1 Tax=Daktulosphaira vitifoliae TaxID=58002 RepID=UPI0021AAD9CE|nr:protein tramtrack, beta isoform-like isoform X2 [Daktulosphaira vitifoliae]